MHDYELVDVGDGMRLERFGSRVVARPHPGADGSKGNASLWRDATLIFDTEHGWTGREPASPWPVRVDSLTIELRPTNTGQVGLFPEQAPSWDWLRGRVAPGQTILNLFAYTGVATLVAAAAGAAVVHVDASRPTLAWARRNADLSHLADRQIRWIVDDAAEFVAREIRRGRGYDGVVLDPPSYGHGAGGGTWRLEEDLAPLLDQCAELVRGTTGFVLLTAHTPGFGPDRLADLVAASVDGASARVERGRLLLRASTGRELELGSFARWPGARS